MEYAVITVQHMKAIGAEHLWESSVRIGDFVAYRHVGAVTQERARESAAEFLSNHGGRLVAVIRPDDPRMARA